MNCGYSDLVTQLVIYTLYTCIYGFEYYSQYKKKRKLLNDIFWGVKIIDCKNDSISVALPFNNQPYSEVLS